MLRRQQHLPQVEKAGQVKIGKTEKKKRRGKEERGKERRNLFYSKSRLSLEAADFSAIAFDSFG